LEFTAGSQVASKLNWLSEVHTFSDCSSGVQTLFSVEREEGVEEEFWPYTGGVNMLNDPDAATRTVIMKVNKTILNLCDNPNPFFDWNLRLASFR